MRPFNALSPTMSPEPDPDWEAATWEGSRREQIRAALGLSLRERFQALDDLIELSRRLAEMPRNMQSREPGSH